MSAAAAAPQASQQEGNHEGDPHPRVHGDDGGPRDPPCHGEHMVVGMDALAVTGDSAIMRDVFPLARVIVLALKRAATVC